MTELFSFLWAGFLYMSHPLIIIRCQPLCIMEKRELETMLAYVETFFRESGAHDLDHVLRVTRLCEVIGEAEHADMQILIPAALFHDIARPQEKKTGIPHQEEGARIAEAYLRQTGYEPARIPAIVHAIHSHRFSTGPEPETLEAKILSDADKLDAMGAVGIARTFMQAGEHGDGIEGAVGHIHEKLLNLRGLMYTDQGAEIAGQRHALLQEFVDSLEDEIEESFTSPAEPLGQSDIHTYIHTYIHPLTEPDEEPGDPPQERAK